MTVQIKKTPKVVMQFRILQSEAEDDSMGKKKAEKKSA